MKLILESWRKFIKESVDPRIQKQVDMLLAIPDLGIAISGDGSFGMSVKYVRIENVEAQQFSELSYRDAIGDSPYPHGAVDIMETEESQEGPCFAGWTVIGAKAYPGWGPLLYEVAIEYASQSGGGLTSDRFSVSKDAQAVWDKYEKRGDVDAQQMDTNHDPDSSGVKINSTVPQLTPDDKSDDCDQARVISKDGPDWHKDSTTKMYKKDNPEVMQVLKAAKRLFVV